MGETPWSFLTLLCPASTFSFSLKQAAALYFNPAMDGGRVSELESRVSALSKDNAKLKNELKFTKETERWACLLCDSKLEISSFASVGELLLSKSML